MELPKQAKPVARPHFIQPHTVFNRNNATPEERLDMAFDLVQGANYNDPMRFSTPVGNCGCHLLSGVSTEMCKAICLL
jgi:cyanobactin biosynthesis protein (PatB/AcyB/McaB family)